FIISGCTNVDVNLRELFRRVAFNICVGNSDDHFRNHGFLLTAKGWTLSPAYDMNPTLNDHQSLLINSKTNKADLSILLNSCEEYMLNPEVAKGIINEVVVAVKDWRVLANRLGIAKREMSLFEGVFDSRCLR
ncbi:MAG: HipA domain-containing protein, partial [Paludibacteraceae bacterium]|nr:HipA domain-containing protein [Paludibacteraceae bacterium]